MHSFVFSSFATLLLASQSLAAAPCDCYKTSAGDYFTTYQFLDFRNGKPTNFDDFFTYLESPTYGGNTVKNTMSSANIAFKEGAMSLLTKNDGTGLQQSADIYSKPSMLHGSFRMHAQITGAPGAVAGFFTYLDAYNEQDIEILTNEADDQIHYTDHDNGGTGTGNPTLNTTFSGSRTNYNTYRLDWVPSKASFIANDGPAKVLTTAGPTKACTLNVNMWSAGEGWGGPMAPGGSATLNVQWIEAVYNPSAAAPSRVRRSEIHHRRQAGSCTNVCNVDGVAKVGTPELA